MSRAADEHVPVAAPVHGTALPRRAPVTGAAELATDREAARARSVLSEELATIGVLVRRDTTRFVREKSRVVGALLQPVIFWLLLGSGMRGTFALPGAHGVSYLEYFFPGVVVMVGLFTAIFTTMSVIEDRHSGFLQAVLVAPGSRVSVVLGKCAGAASVAVIQSLLFALLAPLAGFSLFALDLPLLLGAIVLGCFGLCALGFAMAWWLDSTAAYHAIMFVLLIPMWMLSGAMFPAPKAGFIAWVQQVNPISYLVSAVRRALYAGQLPHGTGIAGSSALLELAVLVAFCVIAGCWATRLCYVRR